MTTRVTTLIMVVIVAFVGINDAVEAQVPVVLQCGESIESYFTEDEQQHRYEIHAEANTILAIYAEGQVGPYEDLKVDMGLVAPNGFVIEKLTSLSGYVFSPDLTDTLITAPLSVDGTYILSILGRTNTGGRYSLSVACIFPDGLVVSDTHIIQSLQCGSIVENSVTRDEEIHRYYLYSKQNDRANFIATSLAGNYETLKVDMGLVAPNGFVIEKLTSLSGYVFSPDTSDEISTDPLSVEGVYVLSVVGRTDTSGQYQLAVSCTLGDGTVINPGQPHDITMPPDEQVAPAPVPEFSGFGFPGLPPVDFTDLARISIPPNTPLNGVIMPAGGEILGYQIDASAGDTVELTFSRLSGNLNLGLAVLNDDRSVIYQASLVTAETMTVRFPISSSGQYVAGIFPLSLLPPSSPEPTVFQIVTTINP